jgi:plasmid stabilization system protein ParE
MTGRRYCRTFRTLDAATRRYLIEKSEYCSMATGHYRIAYYVKSKEEIDVLGVFHGAPDISR